MNVNSVTEVNAQLLATLNGNASQTNTDSTDFSMLISKLLSTASGSTDSSDLLSSLLGTDDESDTDSEIANLLAQYNASQNVLGQGSLSDVLLNGLSNSSDSNSAVSSLLSMTGQTSGNSDVSSSVMSQMLSAFNSDNSTADSGAIPIMSAFPTDAFAELMKINSQNVTAQDSSNTEFSQLSTDEQLQVLKNAMENGEVTIDKDTDITQVINDLSSSYKLSQNVEQAKKSISEQNAVTDSVGTDKVYSFDEIVTDNAEKTDESRSVYLQTLQGVEKAVSDGTEKFTVKLNPNGLGEIVVNLEKSGDSMILNLVASNARTAELLNNQLSNLQVSLSQYNAQVNTVVAPSNESAAYNFNQQMSGQQFSQDNNSSQQNNSQGNYQTSYSGGEDAVAQAAQTLVRSGALNTYA